MSDDSRDLEPLFTNETRSEDRALERPAQILVPGLTLLAHPQIDRVGEQVMLPSLSSGRRVPLSRLEPTFSQRGQREVRPLADPYLSRHPIYLVPGGEPGAIRLEVDPACRASLLVAGTVVDHVCELSAQEVARGVVLLLAQRVALLLAPVDPLTTDWTPTWELIGDSPPLVELRREIRRLATLEIPVLLRGETGTGKELVARALHDAGQRRQKPYVAVNLGAIPPTLAAAELFGTVRGAFTGADHSRPGYFRQAQGGTLFLDEIAEAPEAIQPLLLRVLESGEIQPVGGGVPFRVDVRVVAATDANLEDAVAAGRFRAPLFHRLASYELQVPPLRARREDIGRLLVHFLRQELVVLGHPERLTLARPEDRPWLPAPLVARLAQAEWPGNVRQLKNLARRIAVSAFDQAEVASEQILAWLREPTERSRPLVPDPPSPIPAKVYRQHTEVDDAEILTALRQNRWQLKPAAAQLGISRTALYARIEMSPQFRKAVDLRPDEIKASLERHPGDLMAVVDELEVSAQGLKRRMKQLGIKGPQP